MKITNLYFLGVIMLLMLFTSCSKDPNGPFPSYSINSFSPTSGTVGTHVEIKGENFPATESDLTVSFNGIKARVISISDTLLVVEVPVGAATGKIEVSYKGKTKQIEQEFTVVTNPWRQARGLDGGLGRQYAIAFSLSGRGYISLGESVGTCFTDLWSYDPIKNEWAGIAPFPGEGRTVAVAFTVGDKAYVGGGFLCDASLRTAVSDFWEYTPATNTWKQIASLPGVGRGGASGFSVGDKGYVVGGDSPNGDLAEVWQYNPATNTWKQMGDFGGGPRVYAFSFNLDGTIFMGSGIHGYIDLVDFWAYDALTDTWTRKADFRGPGRSTAVAFGVRGAGYVGTGSNDGLGRLRDFWKYDPASNSWTQVTDFFGGTTTWFGSEKGYRKQAISFVVNNRPFVGLGNGDMHSRDDLWEYFPE
jgi:hypothetical protein